MTKRWRRSSTGNRSHARPALLAALLALLAPALPASAVGQALSVRSLELPADARPGGWASYRVRVQSRGSRPRELTQRVAIVSREGMDDQAGVWVEVKTVDAGGGARIERGFFRAPSVHGTPESDGEGSREWRLARYQALAPGGALYEYSLDADEHSGPGPEISGLSLFQTEGRIPLDEEVLPPDTLKIRGRDVPAVVERTRWMGSEEWSDPADTTAMLHALLSRTTWRVPEVPVTGCARVVFEVTARRFVSDGGGRPSLLPLKEGSEGNPLYRVELELLDRGDDAVPEVTQEAEPAPAPADPRGRPVIPSR